MKLKIDISADEYRIIADILKKHLNSDITIYAFGSRATHKARFNSDLDLALEDKKPITDNIILQLKADLIDAPIAFNIDIVDMQTISDEFRQIIDKTKIIFPLKANSPTLRFSEFNDAWQEKRLGDILDNKSKKFNPKNETTDAKCVELEHLESNTGRLLGYISALEQKSIKNIFTKNDILFGKLRPYLNKFWKANFDGVCSSEIWVLKGNEITNNYLFYLIQCFKFLNLANNSSGSKMPRADWDSMKNEIFYSPSLPEQEKIADFLSAVDKKIDLLNEKKKSLEEYKKGMMQKIFNQEIRFTDNNGNSYPEWQEKKLIKDKIADVKTGASNREDSSEKGEYIFFDRSSDIRFSSNYLFDCEAIIVAGEGKEFTPRYFFGKFDLHQRTYAIMGFNFIKGKFLYYHIDFNKNFFLKFAVGSTMPSLRMEPFYNFPIFLPIKEEQEKIASFLSAIDEKIVLADSQIIQAQQFKKSLLQQMFV